MTKASISELKARLSYYLRLVGRGEEVQILDRGVPVARLTTIVAGSDEADVRARLLAEGILRAGTGDASMILERAPLELPVSISEALDEDRAEGM